MAVSQRICKLRTQAKMSREQFAELFEVSRQSVQKWENGASVPELDKMIRIAKYFHVSLDYLVLGNGQRVMENMLYHKKIQPQYTCMHPWEFYSSQLMIEYEQSIDEGLDIEQYRELFSCVEKLPADERKKKFGDILFEVVINAKQKEGYPYQEPSDLDGIFELRKEYFPTSCSESRNSLERKIAGAWMGRICGCLLGKPIECIKTNELIPLLKETGNYPMHRYIFESDITEEICRKYTFYLKGKCYGDTVDSMPVDDDTNYTVMAQMIIDQYGRDFTAYDVSRAWLDFQKKDAYCTAERVAYRNFINGYEPPKSANYKNPYREWIGAQIRSDYYGYINPGNPQAAAEMAWRDASISHTKNGIYGAMFVAAMLATAAVTDNREDIIRSGLGQIPYTSRLYEAVTEVLEGYRNGISKKKCFDNIHSKFDEYTDYGWCHTIPNAMIVTAALLYGKGNYGQSICMAVETGFDTDCNGATVGSVLGLANGIESIPEEWMQPVNDTLQTSIFGVGTVKISDCIGKTMEHIIWNTRKIACLNKE